MRAIHLYVAVVGFAALSVLWLQDWHAVALLDAVDVVGLLTLIGLGVFADSIAFSVHVTKTGKNASGGFLPLFTTLILFGAAPAVLYMVATGPIREVLIRKSPPIRAAFNASQFVVVSALAGWVFEAAGGVSWFGAGRTLQPDLIPFLAATSTFLVLNQILVAIAIALSQRQPAIKILKQLVDKENVNVVYSWLLSPAAFGLAYLYSVIWWPGVVLAILPLTFVRHAYLVNHRLQETNRALLKALVKAIETRDPYTSGHSLRVSALSHQIAHKMGLPAKQVEQVETAALLHDIGKIEAIYTEILKKPGHLSDEEREIIESHVTKGVDLLTSLGSFPREVIDSVRHHHEREDGKGYPDGIRGNAIPMGARIIKVVDAVDAMLSDRPYRKALTLDQVREQLEIYSGSQFNAQIVRVVVESDLLERHAADLADWRPEPDSKQLDDWSRETVEKQPEPAKSTKLQ